MGFSKVIEHQGVIRGIKDGNIKIDLVVSSACAACHARHACPLSEQQIKTIDISQNGRTFKTGETVNVILEQKKGVMAVFYAFIIPFLLVVSVLLISMAITHNELKAGIIAIIILLPYYLILHLFLSYFKKSITFYVEKI